MRLWLNKMLCAFVTHYQCDKGNFLVKNFTKSGRNFKVIIIHIVKNVQVMYTIFRGFIFIIEFAREKIEKESNTII